MTTIILGLEHTGITTILCLAVYKKQKSGLLALLAFSIETNGYNQPKATDLAYNWLHPTDSIIISKYPPLA